MLLGLPEENSAAATVFLGLAVYKSAEPACVNVGILVKARLNFTTLNTS